MKRSLTAFAITVALALSALAQQPHVLNGKIEPHALSGSLEATLRQLAGSGDGPVWIGYAVPAHAGKPRLICCFDSSNFKNAGCCAGCKLEGRNSGFFNSDGGTCVQGDPPTHLFVFLRFARGQVTRVRPLTPDCGVDATGLTVHWLSDVPAKESVAYLTNLALGKSDDVHDVVDMSISAIGMHADPAADAALDRLVAADQPEKMREKAAFWLASERGRHGFEMVRKLLRDPATEERLRQHLTFVISISGDPEAMPELIRTAHQDAEPRVRGQALFWMAQKAGSKVAGEISDAIDNDPDTEVKKRAVFALSQMSDGEGVPRLIDVARRNRNPAVRKQAVFWLGQSHDPRALQFIEEVLTR